MKLYWLTTVVKTTVWKFAKNNSSRYYIVSLVRRNRPQMWVKKVLYKLLYFNDFNYYELHEVKMTGENYSKLEHGPAPRHFDTVVTRLKEDMVIIEEKSRLSRL